MTKLDTVLSCSTEEDLPLAQAEVDELRKALLLIRDHYVGLVHSTESDRAIIRVINHALDGFE